MSYQCKEYSFYRISVLKEFLKGAVCEILNGPERVEVERDAAVLRIADTVDVFGIAGERSVLEARVDLDCAWPVHCVGQ